MKIINFKNFFKKKVKKEEREITDSEIVSHLEDLQDIFINLIDDSYKSHLQYVRQVGSDDKRIYIEIIDVSGELMKYNYSKNYKDAVSRMVIPQTFNIHLSFNEDLDLDNTLTELSKSLKMTKGQFKISKNSWIGNDTKKYYYPEFNLVFEHDKDELLSNIKTSLVRSKWITISIKLELITTDQTN